MTEQELKDMKLHEEIQITDDTYVLRVYRGWIYTMMDSNGCLETQFVPEITIIQEHIEQRLK